MDRDIDSSNLEAKACKSIALLCLLLLDEDLELDDEEEDEERRLRLCLLLGDLLLDLEKDLPRLFLDFLSLRRDRDRDLDFFLALSRYALDVKYLGSLEYVGVRGDDSSELSN